MIAQTHTNRASRLLGIAAFVAGALNLTPRTPLRQTLILALLAASLVVDDA